MGGIVRVLGYLKARLGEPSTWAGIAAAVAGGAALSAPWSGLVVAAGVMAVLVRERAVG